MLNPMVAHPLQLEIAVASFASTWQLEEGILYDRWVRGCFCNLESTREDELINCLLGHKKIRIFFLVFSKEPNGSIFLSWVVEK